MKRMRNDDLIKDGKPDYLSEGACYLANDTSLLQEKRKL